MSCRFQKDHGCAPPSARPGRFRAAASSAASKPPRVRDERSASRARGSDPSPRSARLKPALRDGRSEPRERGRRAAQAELEMLRLEEITVKRIVAIEAHPAVDVLSGGKDACPTECRPIFRREDFAG